MRINNHRLKKAQSESRRSAGEHDEHANQANGARPANGEREPGERRVRKPANEARRRPKLKNDFLFDYTELKNRVCREFDNLGRNPCLITVSKCNRVMSRICMKNLLKHVAEDELREFFSEKGIITDVKLMRTKDGKSRQFAFTGYRTEKEAHEAIRYFNNSFLRTSKITCENGVDVDDPQLPDFLQVMQPRVNSKMWANDTSGLTSVGNNRAVSNKDNEGASVSTDDSGSLEDGFLDISEPSGKSHEPDRDEVDVEGKEDTSREKVTHEKSQLNVIEHGSRLSKTEDVKGVFESCRLFVRNLPYTTTEEELEEHFSHIGSISQIKSLRLPMKFGSHRGFAFVEYVTQQEAQNALKALSSTHLYGRRLVIERAKEGESLEELRARTASQFSDNHNGFQAIKLSKKRKDVDILDEGKMKFGRFDD
ncbi:Polyadenylate-binding protein [Vigna angularis]|uniref:Polyadenylate-binding protein n=1 Tax=Phaseolus angularis TaxID=3914 RepID=A0A8T0K1Q5_PHAAN|nr:Polyadenylate-binding protein [Vigna angularis]